MKIFIESVSVVEEQSSETIFFCFLQQDFDRLKDPKSDIVFDWYP